MASRGGAPRMENRQGIYGAEHVHTHPAELLRTPGMVSCFARSRNGLRKESCRKARLPRKGLRMRHTIEGFSLVLSINDLESLIVHHMSRCSRAMQLENMDMIRI